MQRCNVFTWRVIEWDKHCNCTIEIHKLLRWSYPMFYCIKYIHTFLQLNIYKATLHQDQSAEKSKTNGTITTTHYIRYRWVLRDFFCRRVTISDVYWEVVLKGESPVVSSWECSDGWEHINKNTRQNPTHLYLSGMLRSYYNSRHCSVLRWWHSGRVVLLQWVDLWPLGGRQDWYGHRQTLGQDEWFGRAEPRHRLLGHVCCQKEEIIEYFQLWMSNTTNLRNTKKHLNPIS